MIGEQLRFTQPATMALEVSLREALSFGHDYVGTEHLLLGLFGNEMSAATLILRRLGVGLDQNGMQQAVLDELKPAA